VQRLPHGSNLRVAPKQTVKAMEVVAVSEMPEERHLIDLARRLRVKPERVQDYLLKQQGDPVSAGEPIAIRRGFLGLGRQRVLSPTDGRIAWLQGGRVLIEGGVRRVEVPASLTGRVLSAEPGEYITIEGHGGVIEVAWGTGGLAYGTIKVMDTLSSYNTESGRFNIDHRGSIVAIGSPLTEQFYKEATDIRVKGIIAASMSAHLLPLVENPPFPIAITQGFGQLPMSDRVLNLLATHNGREIILAMTASDDSRESRPEIIIPISSGQTSESRSQEEPNLTFRVGQRVRILQHPYMGEIGTITRLPEGVQQLPNGLWMPGADVEVSPARTVFVPFANLQHLG
jgi:transcription antitermination factor NusG